MFNGSNTSGSGRTKLYTGMTAYKFLALNPTKSEIETLIGKEYKLNVNYETVEFSGRVFRPIEIWLQDVNNYMEPVTMRFLIGRDDDITQTGTIRFVNDKGVFTMSKSEQALRDNPRQAWYTDHPFRIAKVGENELYTFMQKLMRYNNFDKEAAFMRDAVNLGITPENLFDNKLEGLLKFFNWCNENNNSIVLVAAVRSTSKIVEGKENVYFNQTLVTNPNYFYTTSTGEVSNKSIEHIRGEIAKGNRITKYLFTVEFQPFVKEECINDVPATTISSGSSFDPLSLI